MDRLKLITAIKVNNLVDYICLIFYFLEFYTANY